MTRRLPPRLAALARACGIELEFRDGLGTVRRADADSLRRVLRAMGHAAEDERSAARALTEVRSRASAGSRVRDSNRTCEAPRVATGILANLYTLRTNHDRGFGDFGALAECVRHAARAGLDFVGINPLHALRNRKSDSSPYYPTSRLYRSELYLDVTTLPECDAPEVRSLIDSAAIRRRRQALRSAEALDYDALRKEQRRTLAAAFEAFIRGPSRSARMRAFRDYCSNGGEDLAAFATFVALEEHFGRQRSRWPRRLATRDPAAIARYRVEHRQTIEFHCFVQFELERQWSSVGDLARRSGMSVGLYTDLAIGSAPDSADVWTHPESFIDGFSLGAPPDGYAREGQVWNFPPLNPGTLLRSRGAAFRKLLRASMSGAGAIRIDHAIGLVRQYWVPIGEPGTRGVMVRMPATQLLDIIAEESRRQHCVVVAEDLGTLPKQLPELLERYGLLSSRVLWFSRKHNGEFEDPRRYPRLSLATFGTHDLPPIRGIENGIDLDLRSQLELTPRSNLSKARRTRRGELEALRKRVNRVNRDTIDLPLSAESIHAALARAGSAWVGFALDDVAGESKPVNVPGVTSDRYPVWSRRMSIPVEQIDWSKLATIEREYVPK